MVLREEQERLQLLLREAIPMMCKNGVPYQTEFCVEALIGITIDKSDVVLVSIKETFNKDGSVCQTPEKSPKKRRRKRRKSNSSKQSDVSSGDSDNDQSHPQGGSDGDSYPEPARKTMKPDPNYDDDDYEDNEDELVTIKSEPVNIQGDHSEYEQSDQTFDTFTTTQSPTQNPQVFGHQIIPALKHTPTLIQINALTPSVSSQQPGRRFCVTGKCCLSESNIGISDSDQWKKLMRINNSDQDTIQEYTCNVCTVKFISLQNIKDHIENEHLKDYQICQLNDYCYTLTNDRWQQYLRVEGDRSIAQARKYFCTECGNGGGLKDIKTHIKGKHLKEKIYCNYCEKSFLYLKSCKTHVTTCHKSESGL